MSNYCHSCGNKAEDPAKFCGTCGVELNGIPQVTSTFIANQDINMNLIPENIRLNLKKYDKHLGRTCLECGYVGLMGISRIGKVKKKNWIVWVVCGFGFLISSTYGSIGILIGILIGGLIGALQGMDEKNKTKTFTICPSCSIELI